MNIDRDCAGRQVDASRLCRSGRPMEAFRMIHKPELLLAVLTAVAPLAAQRIQLPAKLSELETRDRQDSSDAAAQYNVAVASWHAKRCDDADSALHPAVRIGPHCAAPALPL